MNRAKFLFVLPMLFMGVRVYGAEFVHIDNPYVALYNRADELVQALTAARAREQSTANKLLGAASIGATGIGAMQAMSATSEKQADEDAERAMKAYLETFRCNYGNSLTIRGGEQNIILPGGNELSSLYQEYVKLATDLKIRKEALGMHPGIESETILDKATTGLYDDVGTERGQGAFISVSRALMDENGTDAVAWAEQKSDTMSKTRNGAHIGGAGVIGGAVGNLIINREK